MTEPSHIISPHILKLKQVCISRGTREILTDANIEFSAGTITAILGPNGAGKSTLLEACCGTLDCQGDMWIDVMSEPASRCRSRP